MTSSIRRTAALAALALAASTALAVAPAFADSTVVVTGNTAAAENDAGGWIFNRDPRNATPIDFTLDTSTIGTGSLYVEPIENVPVLPSGPTGPQKFIGEHFLLTSMDEVQSISYDFLVGNGGNAVTDANEFYMNVYANFDGGTQFGDCVYSVVPLTSSGWTTFTFDPDSIYPVRSRTSTPCPPSPAAMSDTNPNASLRMFALNVGDTSNADEGLDGYFDNVVVATTGGTTTYDFEASPTSKDDCTNGGWMDFGFKNQGHCIRVLGSGKDSR